MCCVGISLLLKMSEASGEEAAQLAWQGFTAAKLAVLPIAALVALAAQWGGDLSEMDPELVAGCNAMQMQALAKGFKMHRDADVEAAGGGRPGRSATTRLDFNSRGVSRSPTPRPPTKAASPGAMGFPSLAAKNDFNVSDVCLSEY